MVELLRQQQRHWFSFTSSFLSPPPRVGLAVHPSTDSVVVGTPSRRSLSPTSSSWYCLDSLDPTGFALDIPSFASLLYTHNLSVPVSASASLPPMSGRPTSSSNGGASYLDTPTFAFFPLDVGTSNNSASSSTSGHDPHSPTLNPMENPPVSAPAPAVKRPAAPKTHVATACGACKRAHLGCDVSRPCKRCVNMGKADMCADVPHKKRGRPKVPKAILGVPYARTRLPLGNEPEPTLGRWRNPPGFDSTHPISNGHLFASSYPPQPNFRPDGYNYGLTPTPPSTSDGPISSPPFPSPPLFTLFASTDLRILRCTPASYPLTGYPPQDFINTSVLDWVMPPDRPLLEMEHGRLMNNPMGPGQLHSDAETQEAIALRGEKELLSPVAGMREPYPNQNVRIMRADHQYSVFNVRLHLGGGLGGNLWHPDAAGKVYFVISLLLLPPPPSLPPASAHTSPAPLPPPIPKLAPSMNESHNSNGVPMSVSLSEGAGPSRTSYRPPPIMIPHSHGRVSGGSAGSLGAGPAGHMDSSADHLYSPIPTSAIPPLHSPLPTPATTPMTQTQQMYAYPTWSTTPVYTSAPSSQSPSASNLQPPRSAGNEGYLQQQQQQQQQQPQQALLSPMEFPQQAHSGGGASQQQAPMQGFYDPQYDPPVAAASGGWGGGQGQQ